MQLTTHIIIEYLNKNGVAATYQGSSGLAFQDVRRYFPSCKYNKEYLYLSTVSELASDWFLEAFCFIIPDISADEVTGGKAGDLPVGPGNHILCSCDESRLLYLLQECFLYYNNWERQLHEQLLHFKGLDDLLDISIAIFNNPLMIDDISFRNLAYASPCDTADFLDREWDHIINYGYHSSEYVTMQIGSPKLARSIQTSSGAFIHHFDTLLAYRSIYCPIRDNEEKTIGLLTIIELSSKLTQGHIDLANFFTGFLAKALGSDRNYLRKRGSFDDSMLRDIIHGKTTDSEICRITFQNAGLQLNDPHFLIRITTADTAKSNDYILMRTVDMLEKQLQASKVFTDGTNVVALVNERRNGISGEVMSGAIGSFISHNSLQAAISMPFHDPGLSHIYNRQAGTAFRFAQFTPGESNVCYYRDVIQYDLLDRLDEDEQLALCHPAIQILSEHDQQNNAALVDTLRLLQKNNGNVITTAQELFLHRNSLYYRLNKITELTGIDFENEAELKQLDLTLKIMDIHSLLNLY